MLVLGLLIAAIVKHASGDVDSLPNVYYAEVSVCPETESGFGVLVSSVLECASVCTHNTSCRSYSVEKSMPGMCGVSSEVLVDTGCHDDSRHFNKLDLPCLNGGIYTAVTDSCRCFHGYIGARCERLMYDCSEGMAYDYYTGMEEIFTIQPPTSPYPFNVWCEMFWAGRTYVMATRTLDPYVDFNRTWEDYKNGFGDLASRRSFWLGNERLHYVTSHRPMVLVIQMQTNQEFSFWNYRQRLYTAFNVGPEVDGFRCNFQTSYANTLEGGIHVLNDCLETQKLMAFSTIDADNDTNATGNCAETHLSGWWYSNCGGCNPTGKMQPMSDTYQSSDPSYSSVPVKGNWAPRTISMFLQYRSG